MAIDFPSSPTNGQIFGNYRYNATDGVWQLLGNVLEVPAVFSNTATGSYTDGYDYDYVSFTSSGTLTVTRGGYADVLLVGGGGAGGAFFGGGGGGGGVLYIENAYLSAGSLDVVVGAGGQGLISNVNAGFIGNNGLPSSLSKYFVPGGGGGGASSNSVTTGNLYYPQAGLNGGSGGGEAGWNYANPGSSVAVGLGVSGLGNNGGPGIYLDGGGGGGAGAVGGTPSHPTGGAGGNGVSNSITGSAVTYGGGGGGCGYDFGGAGGTGGGGAGAQRSSAGTNGTANTGGGGGGGGAVAGGGAEGGSGIVIVRVRTN